MSTPSERMEAREYVVESGWDCPACGSIQGRGSGTDITGDDECDDCGQEVTVR